MASAQVDTRPSLPRALGSEVEMDPVVAQNLLERLDSTLRWTLDGGNDPEDPGDVRQAVREIGEIVREMLMEARNA